MALKGRGPVENLNRQSKAFMVEALLEDALGGPVENYHVLDVGCGNGQISNHFSANNSVFGVDVEDKRKDKHSAFKHSVIIDECLPFEDSTFDIVVSHHVIEHVYKQEKHLSEIFRVLKPQGIVYLACPNKASPFMSGHIGNESLLNKGELEVLIKGAGFIGEEYYTRLLSQPFRYHYTVKIGAIVPEGIIKIFHQWYPNHCYILRKN